MAEEKVHGGVQFGVNFDDYNHTKIPYHSDTVDGQECQEEGLHREFSYGTGFSQNVHDSKFYSTAFTTINTSAVILGYRIINSLRII